MVTTLDDTKRIAIGMKLADMKALQNLLIANEQKFISALADDDLRKRIQDMLDDDQKNLGVLDTVIIQYGVKAEPKESTTKIIGEAQKLMESSELTLFEKVSQHELLKHKQTMTGLLIHKAAQVVGADVEAAITPLNTVNFENRAHQEQLKGILEILGVRELTGQEADQGLWGRVQDAVAALSGVFGSAVTQTSDRSDMTIGEILRMDHSKAKTLFMEIENSNDAQKIQEYFGQLYKDLMAHAKAEEQVVYPAVRSYYQDTQDLYNEQAEQARMLDEIKAMSPSSSEFKAKVRQLSDATNHHINQEENEMFAKLRDNFSSEQQQQMATEFKSVKSKLQDQMAASSK
ncbi:hemerythrin domain-containing protein [Coleofasciculus sp. FACHB-64]|uniref:hemerythrin domain-containing protein n=1 Tax=Cyanophyceae TaxID=3028117 RepID=UPI0016838D09|nr:MULTISPECIES: hemerythrin domain-containing protein [unclassified Coleofasciculus]MBD1837012.1 hemerythrin domain-containing protein [Coleofasciculus sp. FACHB-501]MBD1877581.1 hemerythrin domain-containing protein [Coleofasciculus sp. FACHB-T130]MBD1891674.1 hemerythrin domain-containing protein [Coleofasciculus sp. FACHB-SPT9]MBD1897968.1 hemerythrin domain-containing protein [Coleofasciculus sp. FACHB-129]MBD1902838.1 hemerythrin domain-containing protein [Coleofasciculus sp. FACHB-125]